MCHSERVLLPLLLRPRDGCGLLPLRSRPVPAPCDHTEQCGREQHPEADAHQADHLPVKRHRCKSH